MKILITGAGGRVGRVLRQELARDHQLRLLDICAIENPEGEAIQGSVADLEIVQRAVAGMDGVVHMAIHMPGERQRQSEAEYMQSDVDVGVKGTDMMLWAAKAAGVRRFVYTSTISIYDYRYPAAGEFLTDADETLSRSHYGMVKRLAEELCRHYALAWGLPTIVLRFNSVTFPEVWAQNQERESPEAACTRVHIEDVVRAVRLAVEKEGLPWGRCLISGDNPDRRYDTATAAELIGFRARYGFEVGKIYRDGELIVGGG